MIPTPKSEASLQCQEQYDEGEGMIPVVYRLQDNYLARAFSLKNSHPPRKIVKCSTPL